MLKDRGNKTIATKSSWASGLSTVIKFTSPYALAFRGDSGWVSDSLSSAVNMNRVTISRDGQFMFIGYRLVWYGKVGVYKRNATDTGWNNTQNITLTSYDANVDVSQIAISDDNSMLAIGHTRSPYADVNTYTNNGSGVFINKQSLGSTSTSNTYSGVALSEDGTRLIIADGSNIQSYRWNGSSWSTSGNKAGGGAAGSKYTTNVSYHTGAGGRGQVVVSWS